MKTISFISTFMSSIYLIFTWHFYSRNLKVSTSTLISSTTPMFIVMCFLLLDHSILYYTDAIPSNTFLSLGILLPNSISTTIFKEYFEACLNWGLEQSNFIMECVADLYLWEINGLIIAIPLLGIFLSSRPAPWFKNKVITDGGGFIHSSGENDRLRLSQLLREQNLSNYVTGQTKAYDEFGQFELGHLNQSRKLELLNILHNTPEGQERYICDPTRVVYLKSNYSKPCADQYMINLVRRNEG